MSTIQNLTEGIANADVLASVQGAVADTVAPIICEFCKTPLTVAEIQAQLETGDAVEAMCDKCAETPQVAETADDNAAMQAEIAVLRAKLAEQEAKDKAAEKAKLAKTLADLQAKNAKIKADNAAKGNGKPDAAPKVAVAKSPQVAATQALLATDCRPGVIDPKHLKDSDKFLLSILLQFRTKQEKLTKVDAIPGTLAVKLFHFFGPKGCNFSWDKINGILAEAMTRNVISKMYFTNSKTGKEMITYFDAQWRPNIKRADDRPDVSMVALAKALWGEASK